MRTNNSSVSPNSGTFAIEVRFDLCGDTSAHLSRLGMSVEAIAMRAFIEAANAGNGFNVLRHTFSVESGQEKQVFCVQSRFFGQTVRLGITPVPHREEDDVTLPAVVDGHRPTHH